MKPVRMVNGFFFVVVVVVLFKRSRGRAATTAATDNKKNVRSTMNFMVVFGILRIMSENLFRNAFDHAVSSVFVV